mmetsp:Transcript_10335/g.31133  ORF Transcript_10335/g.31133 Transcript_10335/m.31133 type:complete len:168 (-) Transcript_10335:43-546(-)
MALRALVASAGRVGMRPGAATVWARMSSSPATSSQEVILPGESEAEVIKPLNGVPAYINERAVRITQPARKVTQSGRYARAGGWKIMWDTQKRWENPLMGWGSNADPMSNIYDLNFDSQEAAVAFAEKNGWKYYVYEQPQNNKKKILGTKMYGKNFSWDKRTRNNTK